jgi:hypothetical protein
MNKYILGLVAVLLLGLGIGYLAHKPASPQQVLGNSYNAQGYNPQYFYNGVYVTGGTTGGATGGKYDYMSNSSTTPTTTLSSLAVAGHLTIGAGQTVESASTTAISSSSDRVVVQLEQTTPIAGVTCNTTLNASSSEASTVFASTTNTSLNGFTINVASAPVTNPFCYSYSISHGFVVQ